MSNNRLFFPLKRKSNCTTAPTSALGPHHLSVPLNRHALRLMTNNMTINSFEHDKALQQHSSTSRPVPRLNNLIPRYVHGHRCEWTFERDIGDIYRLERIGGIWTSFLAQHGSNLWSAGTLPDHGHHYNEKSLNFDYEGRKYQADLELGLNRVWIFLPMVDFLTLHPERLPATPEYLTVEDIGWNSLSGWEYLNANEPFLAPFFEYAASWFADAEVLGESSAWQPHYIFVEPTSERWSYLAFWYTDDTSTTHTHIRLLTQKFQGIVRYNPKLQRVVVICHGMDLSLAIEFIPGFPDRTDASLLPRWSKSSKID